MSSALLPVRTDTHGVETRYIARGEPVLFRLLSPGEPELRIKFGSDAAGGDSVVVVRHAYDGAYRVVIGRRPAGDR